MNITLKIWRQKDTKAPGALVAYHTTPGYETYKGLGWLGVILGAASQGLAP